MYFTWTRRRLHLSDSDHCAGECNEGSEGGKCFLSAQGDATEPFDLEEEILDEVALVVEFAIQRQGLGARRIGRYLCLCPKAMLHEGAEMIRVIGCVRDDVADPCQAIDKAARLRAISGLTRSDGVLELRPV